MIDAWNWLSPRINEAPATLRERMRVAVESAAGDSIHEQLAAGAASCLRVALKRPSHRPSAMDLLAGDALLTHACAAAAEAGPAMLIEFTATLDARYFERIMSVEA